MAVLSAVKRAVRSSLDVAKELGNKIPGTSRLPSFNIPGSIPILGGYTLTGGFLGGVLLLGLVTGMVPFIPHYSQVM